MSPAAVNFWPPVSSQSNSDPNPTPGFAPSARNNVADNCKQSVKIPVFADASEFRAPGLPTGRAFSGRAKPRLAKLRKQLHRRSTAVSGEFGSDFNPFGDFISNGFLGKRESSGVYFSGVSLVFSADSASNLNSAGNLDSVERNFGAKVEEVGAEVESVGSDNWGFVVGPKGRQFNGNDGKLVPEGENRKLENAGFVFGANCKNIGVQQRAGDGKFGSVSNSNAMEGIEFQANGSNKGFNLAFQAGESNNCSEKAQSGTSIFASSATQNSATTNGSIPVSGFVFGGCSEKSSNSDERLDEMKLYNETSNSWNESRDQNGSINDERCTPAFESSSDVASASTSTMNPIHNLHDEIKNLNIGDFENVVGPGGKKFFSNSGSWERTSHEMSAAGTSDSLGVSSTQFKAPECDFSCLKASLFPELIEKKEFSVRGRKKMNKRSQIMRGKLNQHSLNKQQVDMNPIQNEGNTQESPYIPGNCSPMDFSPYDNTTSVLRCSAEPSIVSNDFTQLDNNISPAVCPLKVATGLRKGKDLDKDDKKSTGPNEESSGCQSERSVIGDKFSKQSIFGAETFGSHFNSLQDCTTGCAGVTSAEDTLCLNTEHNGEPQLSFSSGLQDLGQLKFSFSASSSQSNSSSTSKPLRGRKKGRKGPHKPFVIPLKESNKVQEEDYSSCQRKAEANEEAKRGPSSSTVACDEACEKWRLRGNQAYKKGDMSKAEDFYTRGINSVPSSETSGCCIKPLVICYSNRAATRMSLGYIRAALSDCVTAAALDPIFLKVQMRAGNCHLVLGEVEDALHYFNKCLESGADVCLDRRITIEAATGQQNAQKVANCMDHCVKILEQRRSDAVPNALDAIDKALSISPYSERLLEMKAEFMFMLRRYEQVIQLCKDTLCAADKNFASVGTDGQFVEVSSSHGRSYSSARLWRGRLISKSQFYLGRLEVALDSLDKLEPMGSINDEYSSKILASSLSLGVTIRELLEHKNAGNEAFRSGRYTEAVEHYSAALSTNVESRPFAAICFCNRAAAYQAMGQIADAIADCSLAIALDASYHKAVSRRASLHEMIRDYGQAARDLQRLVSIFENQSDGKSRQSGTPGRANSSTNNLRQAHQRLSLMEEKAKKGSPLDLYLILGVKVSDPASEIKRAYRKAALRHHPDKAGQFLARSESGDEGRLWKEIVEEVHTDADRLFKMIGEAYAVLSDVTKRLQYDLDEDIRKGSKECDGSRQNGKTSDGYSYPFERSQYRRDWQDGWKTHGHSRYR